MIDEVDAMRRIVPVMLLLMLGAACDNEGAPPSSAPTAQLRASFPAGGIVDTIVVDAIERLPLRAAELVAPDGTATPASYVNVAASPRFATGQVVAGDPWLTPLSGGGGPAPLIGHAEALAAMQSQSQLLATVSTADIPLADPVVYRRDWTRYRIRLTFGTPPSAVETREIAAPEPPPQAPPS
jgi:hypothetical protein